MITKNCDVIREKRQNMRGGKGSITLEHWFKADDFGAKVRLCCRIIIAPGASIGTHIHENEDEIYIVISGQGMIEENGEWVPITAGDAILTGDGGSHGVKNNSDAPLVIAAIIHSH
ncbi:MAG: cupin domain-containing protein [Kiritimatiellia bacterium]